MPRARIQRDTQTMGYSLGAWFVDDERRWDTIELPWEDNRVDRSCIPAAVDRYTLDLRWSKKHGHAVFGIHGAPLDGRQDIEVHAANWPSQLLGCVAVGTSRGTLSGATAVLGSGAAFGELMSAYGCPVWATLTTEALVAEYIRQHPECVGIPLDVLDPVLDSLSQ